MTSIEQVKTMANEIVANEAQLNTLGYDYFYDDKPAEALAILWMTLELFPTSLNALDSYVEVLLASGKHAEALPYVEDGLRLAQAQNDDFATKRFMGFAETARQSNLALASKPEGTRDLHISDVGDSAWLLQDLGYGTNIGVLSTEQGLVLIDPMTRDELRGALQGVLAKLSPQPVVAVHNTHSHQDHAGANDFFAEKGARLASCSDAIKDIVCKTVSSHSSHDTVYYHPKSNMIFTGDVYDTNWHPTFYAGGIQGLKQAVDTIVSMGNDDSLIVPGHGAPTGKQELQTFLKNTLLWYDRVKFLLTENHAPEAIAEDPDLQKILQGFVPQAQTDFVPEEAYKKFIARTVALIEKEKQQNH